jgi:hypothetical protein
MLMKNFNDSIGNRTHDLPACSAVPQPTASPHSTLCMFTLWNLRVVEEFLLPSSVAARSKAWVCGRSLVGILGPWMSVFWECCGLSGRGLWVGLITRPEGSYWVWCVKLVWFAKPRKGRSWPGIGSKRHKKREEFIIWAYLRHATHVECGMATCYDH